MKYLITGGCGFIGSNFLQYVTSKYEDDYFVCLDCLTYAGNFNNIKDLVKKNNFKFIKGDIRDNLFLDKLFQKEKFDFVINFAAESHVDNSILNPRVFMETNVLGTLNLLNLSLKYKIKRYHQVSTDEVYGFIPLEVNKSFKETSNINPSNPYSASKASADLLVNVYYKTYGLDITISRCSNNFGPFQFPEKLIPVTIMKALKNEKIPVHGNGENIRDWIYVLDHVIAIDKIVRHGKSGEVYNISANNLKKNIEIVKLILNYLNKPLSLIEYVADRPGNDLKYAMNSNKIKNELEFKTTYDFKEYLEKTLEWYLGNQEWLKDIQSIKYKE